MLIYGGNQESFKGSTIVKVALCRNHNNQGER